MSIGVCRRCLRTKSSIARNGLCWSCRERLARPVRRRRRAAEVRNPPRPPYEGLAGAVLDLDGQQVGRLCALCGTPVEPPRRTWCSQRCVDVWTLATSPDRQRHQLAALLGARCQGCGGDREPDGSLFVDHVRPLWSLSDPERRELRWWLPFNLQLLGPRCHADKTRREAASRAVYRRAQAAGRPVRYAG